MSIGDSDNEQSRFVEAILNIVGEVPHSLEAPNATPESRAQRLRRNAAWQAAALSGTLALPPGPIGFLTILPDLLGIWRLQRQMIADIAAAYGRTAVLGREQMIYCLFRHAASHAVRDLVVRAGQRVFVRRASLRVIQRTLAQVGVKVTQRVAGRSITTWVPVVGAAAVGTYAYYDTRRVGATAIELFSQPVEIGGDDLMLS